MEDIGALSIGDRAFGFASEMDPKTISEALGKLEKGECVYLIRIAEGALESHLLVPPRTEGSEIVRQENSHSHAGEDPAKA